jgi:hypothetical protein
VPDLVKLALAVVAGVGAAQALVLAYRRQLQGIWHRQAAVRLPHVKVWAPVPIG